VGLWPGLGIQLLVNLCVWSVLIFYHIRVQPVGDLLFEMGMAPPHDTAQAINVVILTSLYAHLSIILLPYFLIDFISLRPFFSTWEMWR